MWWGYSSALDLVNECDLSNKLNSSDDEATKNLKKDEVLVNALLVGQSDNRHVLNTLAKKYRHEENVVVNLYVCESLLENVARDLLFLVLALEPAENIGLADKTKFFMELYGNTLIRPAASNYLSHIAQQLLLMVTDSDYAKTNLPEVSLDDLKYKERDQLEVIFKYWSSRDTAFDILTSWDQRLRKTLGMRYDARYGVFDWDYHMRYRSFGADILNLQEYKVFREKGMSFYTDDTDPCIPNRTLASAIISAGSKIINYGYLGDIVTGPYPTFGFDCEDKSMLEKVNGCAKKTATSITENNIMRIFYEILHQQPFHSVQSEDEGCNIYMADTSKKLQIKYLESDSINRKSVQVKKMFSSLVKVDKCKVIFLSTTALKDCLNKPVYQNFFDLITFPQVMVLKYMTPEIIKLMKPNSKIIVDTPKYLLNYRNEDLEKYKSDLENLMKECHCKNLSNSFNYSTDEFMKFQVIK